MKDKACADCYRKNVLPTAILLIDHDHCKFRLKFWNVNVYVACDLDVLFLGICLYY